MEYRSHLELDHLTSRHVGPIDLALAAGECVTFSGPSGAGKTLLLRAVADLDPAEGRVLLDGTACGDMEAPQWRRRVGMLPAESAWWGDTVGMHFGTLDNGEIRRLGFSPEVADWEVSRLSTGERQRLGLIRLLENRPQALLLDEPTANLDPDSTLRVEELVTEYMRREGASCLWVSHDAAQVGRVSNRHFILRDGRLHEARGPDDKEQGPWA